MNAWLNTNPKPFNREKMMKPNLIEILQHEKQLNPESEEFRPSKFLRTQPSTKTRNTKGRNRPRMLVRGSLGPRTDPDKKTILLISHDTRLHQDLRWVANTAGQIVVRVGPEADITQIMYVVRPAVVLLDLDLPAEAGWEKADALLQAQHCPPMILLTARSEQFDIRTAIQAGSLVEKSDPRQLLDKVNQVLAEPQSCQVERNAIQRVVIGWLRPCSWCVSVTPAYRFWGINE
jgi:CheY-like chemotaxis protein